MRLEAAITFLCLVTSCSVEQPPDELPPSPSPDGEPAPEVPDPPEPPVAEAAPPFGSLDLAITCPNAQVIPERSLIATEPEILERFSFERVLRKINSTGNSVTGARTLYRNWFETFAACAPEVDPNGYGLVCARPEAQLATLDPFATAGPRFVPVAIVNRFDLAPASGDDCGEYRIVYALVDSPGDRGFVAFEARLPNPVPSQGAAGCAGVADFWSNLSVDASATSRATKLEQFFFSGLLVDGVAFPPAIQAAHYGTGQVRTNLFVDAAEWQLRELKLRRPCADTERCQIVLKHATVKANPAGELFRGEHANAADFTPQFLANVEALASREPALIRFAAPNRFNELESRPQHTEVLYRSFTRAGLRTKIAAQITNPALTVDNVLDRATTQTCAGCHQLSNGVALGDGVVWPASLGFTHIDEQRQLSPALRFTFLPHRVGVLRRFLEERCATN